MVLGSSLPCPTRFGSPVEEPGQGIRPDVTLCNRPRLASYLLQDRTGPESG